MSTPIFFLLSGPENNILCIPKILIFIISPQTSALHDNHAFAIRKFEFKLESRASTTKPPPLKHSAENCIFKLVWRAGSETMNAGFYPEILTCDCSLQLYLSEFSWKAQRTTIDIKPPSCLPFFKHLPSPVACLRTNSLSVV